MDPQQDDVSNTNKKAKGTRRVWRKMEEDALMRCMATEYSDKWSADNGFRSGFFTLLEKELDKVLPESKIKAAPHIESKVKYWKQTYNKICDIVALSGFGWDDVHKRIDVDPSVWDEWEKANVKKAKGMYGRSFPYFDDWQIVFGKDRATGEFAEDPSQMANPDPIERNNEGLGQGDEDFYEALFADEYVNSSYSSGTPTAHTSTPTASTTHTSTPTASERRIPIPIPTPQTTTPPANTGNKKGKKRSRMGDDELSMMASMENWMNASAGHMEKIANSLGYDKELSIRRTMLPVEIAKLDLTLTQRFKIGAVISSAEDRIDTFYGTRDDEKEAWVLAVLDGTIYGPV